MALDGSDISLLYSRHADALLRFIVRRTLDAQSGIDLLGETFAVAFEKRNRFRGKGVDDGASAWLYGIARNLLNDYFRTGAIERRALNRLGVDPPHATPEEIERIEELAETSALRVAVAEALADLSPDHRKALELRVIHERSYPEMAAELLITEDVARARVSRALRRLRDLVDRLDMEEFSEHA